MDIFIIAILVVAAVILFLVELFIIPGISIADSAGNVLRADYLSGCRSNSSCSGSNYLFQSVHGYKSGFRNAGG